MHAIILAMALTATPQVHTVDPIVFFWDEPPLQHGNNKLQLASSDQSYCAALRSYGATEV